MIRAMAVGEYGRRYLLGSEAWSVKRIFDFLADLTHQPRPDWKVPYLLALAVAYVSEFVADTITKQSPAATITGVKLTRRGMTFDASRSLTALGLVPRPVSDSIREFVAEQINTTNHPRAEIDLTI